MCKLVRKLKDLLALYIVYNYKFYVATGLVIIYYFVTLLLFIHHQIQQNIKSYMLFYEDIIKL